MENLDDLIKQEFFLNNGNITEEIFGRLITIQLTQYKILERLVEMGLSEEDKLLDPNKARKEMFRLTGDIDAVANIEKAKLIAELAVRNKKDH